MKRISVRIISIAVLVVLALSLAGCSSSSSVRESGHVEPQYKADYNGYSMMDAEEYAYDYGFAASGAAVDNTWGTDLTASERAEVKDDIKQDLNPEKIIYSADATVETTDFETAIGRLSVLIAEKGGWIESSSINGVNYSNIARGHKTTRSASYTIRVPNDKFDSLVGSLSDIGNVPYNHIYTENVTAQYYDTQARLDTYQAQEKRLVQLLDEAETVSDVIEIENELTEVRYRIESVQTSLRNWDRRVSWSTIYLTVNEVFEYTPVKERSYFGKLWDALKDGFENLGDVFIGFVEALPVLLFIGAILFAAVCLVRFLCARGKARRARKAEERARKSYAPIDEADRHADNSGKKETENK